MLRKSSTFAKKYFSIVLYVKYRKPYIYSTFNSDKNNITCKDFLNLGYEYCLI